MAWISTSLPPARASIDNSTISAIRPRSRGLPSAARVRRTRRPRTEACVFGAAVRGRWLLAGRGFPVGAAGRGARGDRAVCGEAGPGADLGALARPSDRRRSAGVPAWPPCRALPPPCRGLVPVRASRGSRAPGSRGSLPDLITAELLAPGRWDLAGERAGCGGFRCLGGRCLFRCRLRGGRLRSGVGGRLGCRVDGLSCCGGCGCGCRCVGRGLGRCGLRLLRRPPPALPGQPAEWRPLLLRRLLLLLGLLRQPDRRARRPGPRPLLPPGRPGPRPLGQPVRPAPPAPAPPRARRRRTRSRSRPPSTWPSRRPEPCRVPPPRPRCAGSRPAWPRPVAGIRSSAADRWPCSWPMRSASPPHR